TLTVKPLPEAEKTLEALFSVICPVSVTVPPVPASEMPAPPLEPIVPDRVIVPPVMPEMLTGRCPAVFCVMLPAQLTVLLPPLTRNAVPLLPLSEPPATVYVPP